MHDINFSHEHELKKHDFLGCCKDCQHSLEIIKPHIMAFAERIKHYDAAALRALSPDDLYRLFLLLDDLAHMDTGDHLAGLILNEHEIYGVLPLIRAYYNLFFSIHEVHLAEQLLESSNPWVTFSQFPLYPRYEALIKNQMEVNDIGVGSRLAFIGCGPVPQPVRLLSERGYRATGIEPVPSFVTRANTYLEGTYSELYPTVPRDRRGLEQGFTLAALGYGAGVGSGPAGHDHRAVAV